jgi:hypothetical protein
MRHMLLAATALVMLSGAAYAQSSADSASSATLSNTTSSGSMSSATGVNRPVTNIIGNPIGNGASSSTSQANASANTRSASSASATGNRSNFNGSFSGRQNQALSVGNTRNSTTINYAIGSGSSGASGDGSGTNGGSGSGGATPQTASGDPAYSVTYGGGYTIHNVPEVIPPNVVGGNPCAIGASGGLAVSGFGIAGGATWADKQCERRQQAALLYNFGKQKAATELMCQDDSVRAALRIAGEPCVADQMQPPAAHAAAAMPVAITPVAAPAAPVAAPVAAKKARPEWCYTASPAELRRHGECDVKL